jgi:AraC-like DNA-binding protein
MRAVFTFYVPLQKVNEHIQQHPSEVISLREAAEIAGIEMKYFSRYFHEKTGVNSRNWTTHTRITQAMEMHVFRNYLIIDVVFKIGFKDLRSFERAFKKCTGMTPSGFRGVVRPDDWGPVRWHEPLRRNRLPTASRRPARTTATDKDVTGAQWRVT